MSRCEELEAVLQAQFELEYADEDDWFDYRLEHDERFLKRIAESRGQIKNGAFIRLADLPEV